MSKADDIFIRTCREILDHGTDTKGQAVRPHWPDGEPAYTIKAFGICNTYDLREEFPAITIRKVPIKSSFQEILWIYQMGSNNINDLGLHIWDEWADEDGSIGKAYGYQANKRYNHHKIKTFPSNKGHVGPAEWSFIDNLAPEYPSAEIRKAFNKNNEFDLYIAFNQIDSVIYDLRHTPFSRRIMMNLWDNKDLYEMNLQPCCWSVTFNVTDEGQDKLVLNMVLNQRSNDVLAANAWNVSQYALLLMAVAQCVNMIPGKMVHMIADCHIYDRHVPIIEEIISREKYYAPTVRLNPEITTFSHFTKDDVTVENYNVGGPQIKFEVAI